MSVRPPEATASLLQVDAIVGRLAGRAALQEVCRFLRASFGAYGWVGVYRRDGATLVLEAWEGTRPTDHTRIPVDQGLCGKAVREERTIRVDDVRSAPDYLACFLETRSEIVVPIRDGATVTGEIDIDGDRVAAYDASDERFLEQVARKLGAALRAAGAEPPPPP